MTYNAYKVEAGDVASLVQDYDITVFENAPDGEFYITEADAEKVPSSKVSLVVIGDTQNDATAGGYPIRKKRKMYD